MCAYALGLFGCSSFVHLQWVMCSTWTTAHILLSIYIDTAASAFFFCGQFHFVSFLISPLYSFILFILTFFHLMVCSSKFYPSRHPSLPHHHLNHLCSTTFSFSVGFRSYHIFGVCVCVSAFCRSFSYYILLCFFFSILNVFILFILVCFVLRLVVVVFLLLSVLWWRCFCGAIHIDVMYVCIVWFSNRTLLKSNKKYFTAIYLYLSIWPLLLIAIHSNTEYPKRGALVTWAKNSLISFHLI